MFLMIPPLPMFVFKWIPIPVLERVMCSANTFVTPPEVSLPTAIPANGEDPVIRRIVMSLLGRP